MPELPEVETTCLGLNNLILTQQINKVLLRRLNLRIPFPDNLDSLITNQTILKISRKAKYILLFLSNELVIIIHLGMSGKLIVKNLPLSYNKHDHLIIFFNSNQALIFNDPRRFGLLTICHIAELTNHRLFANLGIEPLDEQFNYNYLSKQLNNRQLPIKNLLMNNKYLVGVGNIYACESLFRAKISPLRMSASLSQSEIKSLIISIKEVLLESIKAGGSSLKDYADVEGNIGFFQKNFAVYNQAQETCKICKTFIKKIKQAGRSTFFCPSCQK